MQCGKVKSEAYEHSLERSIEKKKYSDLFFVGNEFQVQFIPLFLVPMISFLCSDFSWFVVFFLLI